MKKRVVKMFGLVGALLFAVAVQAADYPQFRGPDRDGHSPETGLLQEWSEDGPALLWKAEGLGRGYSQPIYANGVVYIAGDIESDLTLSAVNAKDGELIWRRQLNGEAWKNDWPGARSAPTYDAASNRLYVLTPHGTLSARNAADGEEVWSRKMSGHRGGWGYAESPLVTEKFVIVTPGGQNTMAALDKDTGEEVWKTAGVSMEAHYCSAILAKVGGKTLVVNGTGGGLLGVDVETGSVEFTNDFCKGNTANIPSPLYDEASGLLFWANGYGKGGIVLALAEDGGGVVITKATPVENAQVQIGSYVRVGPAIYAASDRESLFCLDPTTGEMNWTAREVRKGSIIYADGRLYCFSENNGTVVLVDPDVAEYREKGRFQVPGSGHAWAHPALADKKLFIRYGDHGDTVYAYDIAAE